MLDMKRYLTALILALFLLGCIGGWGSSGHYTTLQNKTFKIGETASDGKIAITVYGKSTATRIDTSRGPFYAAMGNELVILDIGIENLQNDKIITIEQQRRFRISDEGLSDSYGFFVNSKGEPTREPLYEASQFFTPLTENTWVNETLQPKTKARGHIIFEVPQNASRLQLFFGFDYPSIGGNVAVFDIK
ncbi:DUF4352 domain-containing protein [Candidatus Micrarchaeota archaeon]|nr:DUF4352 domain-containing protein [Candidatus Micrarchaeota archaeon]